MIRTVGLLLLISCGGLLGARLTLGPRGPPPLAPPLTRASTPLWGQIEQRVDNFNPTDTRTWMMRYLSNDEFFVSGGPMIIFLGGEWTIEETRLMTGQVYELAEENNGYMFYTEHRYYGFSYPTEDFTTTNLTYLSADQALADVAYFIQAKKAEIEGLENSKVVVIGGSYTGSLATWARLKYPHLVDMAYSSSGPLRSVVDFHEYFAVIQYNLQLVSEECVRIIEEGVEETENQLETEEGRDIVSTLFDTCHPVINENPYRAFFFNALGEVFAGIVQYAEVGQLVDECAKIEGYSGSSMEKLAQYVKDDLNGECLGTYEDFLELYADTKTTDLILRQWFYQCCTEYGYFQTTTSDEQPFRDTFPMDLYYSYCRDLFGVDYQPEMLERVVARTNVVYGGDEPEITKLISIHGTVDPWHPLGLLANKSESVITVVVDGVSHCKDLAATSDSDIDQMKAAKLLIHELINTWLNED